MSFAIILAVCLLALGAAGATTPRSGGFAYAEPAAHNRPADSAPQNSPAEQSAPPSATETPENPNQAAPAPHAPTSTPCSANPQLGSTAQVCKPASASASKSRKQAATQKATSPSGSGPTKTVVRNGGTSESTVQISEGLNQQQASRELQTTNQLLATTDANLKKIANRQLNSSQQDTLSQIRSYMQQARTAANSGDLQRAHTLASKANLLSAELASH